MTAADRNPNIQNPTSGTVPKSGITREVCIRILPKHIFLPVDLFSSVLAHDYCRAERAKVRQRGRSGASGSPISEGNKNTHCLSGSAKREEDAIGARQWQDGAERDDASSIGMAHLEYRGNGVWVSKNCAH